MRKVEDLRRFYTNTEYSGTGESARKTVVSSALSTSCYFVHNQIGAINVWERLRTDPDFRKQETFGTTSAITNFRSHYNNIYPYMGDSIAGNVEGLPNNERYHELFIATKDGYDGLERRSLRYVFGGEEALARDNPNELITLEEVQNWMVAHSARPDGLVAGVTGNIQNRTELTAIDGGRNLYRYFHHNGVNHRDGDWVDLVTSALFERFPDDVLRLAVYKLACGIAIIDQAIKEAAYLKIPIPGNYYPNPLDNGDYLPPLNQLWAQAQHLIAASSDPQDKLLQGLFSETI